MTINWFRTRDSDETKGGEKTKNCLESNSTIHAAQEFYKKKGKKQPMSDMRSLRNIAKKEDKSHFKLAR